MKNNILNLKKEIYSLDNINEAVGAYKDICSIDITEIDNEYILCFVDTKYDANKTMNEFENYLIALENS